MFIEPPGYGGTFRFDGQLPSLPLPELKDTLNAYYESCVPYLTEEELMALKETLERFEAGVGAQLHALLKEKAETSRNWVSDSCSFILL
jgi:carnitine O-octanoyltransferase